MWESIIDRALHIAEMAMEGQTPAQRAEFWQMYLDDIKELRAFIKEHRLVLPTNLPTEIFKRNSIREMLDNLDDHFTHQQVVKSYLKAMNDQMVARKNKSRTKQVSTKVNRRYGKSKTT